LIAHGRRHTAVPARTGEEKDVTATDTVAAGEHHPTAWYADMSDAGRKTFWAATGGWILDALDVQMFSFTVPAVMAAFSVTKEDIGLIGTVTLATSSVGGWLAGALSDRVGRVLTLQITVAWFAMFTFLCGFAQDYYQLFAFRALMGFGFGGEWAAAAMLVGEVIRPEHRGRAVGAMQTGWPVGWGFAVLVATLFFSVFPQDVAWRILFWFGLSPALLIFYVRRHVGEPPVYAKTRENLASAGRRADFLEIFKPAMLRTTILSCLLCTGALGGYYAITFWIPTFLQKERHLTVLTSGGYLAVIITASIIGCLLSAWMNDRIGRRPTFILFAAGSVIAVICYTLIPVTNDVMLYLGFPLGFFSQGLFAGVGPFLTELFPTRMRGSGQGFAYNFGRGIAALNPYLIGVFSDRLHLPLGQSIGLLAAIAYGLMVAAAIVLPETRGRELTSEAS
jgi:MFS family permease